MPWELDPAKHTTYDEELLKEMIKFKMKFDEKKQEREGTDKKDTIDKPSVSHRPIRRGRGHGKSTRPSKKR